RLRSFELRRTSRATFSRKGREYLLGRREERQRRAVGRLPDQLHLLADLELLRFAIDDIGLHRHTLLQRDVGNHVGASRRLSHVAEGVDGPLTRTLLPHGLVGEAERTDRAWEIMRLAAGDAAFDHELAGLRRFPERRGLGIGHRCRIFLRVSHYTRSRMQVEAAWRTPKSPPVPCAIAR